jgi:16S rRNA (guanine966-N2)-methyltransferase
MENRRQPPAAKPFSPKKYYDKNRENTPNNYVKYPPREGSDRFQPRENNDRFQPREGDRFQSRETGGRFQPRNNNDRFQPRDNRNNQDNRDNRDNRTGGFRNDNNRNFSKGYNKFQPNNRFQDRSKTTKPWEKENNIKIVSDMQITDGKHKGKYLQSTASPKVKPTVRRVRETMFKILFRKIRARRFLDLCAGAGTVGIEAISRGAMVSTFVERSAKMCSFIKKNLENCEIKTGHGEVFEIELMPFLKRMAKRRRYWDVVYFDPPLDSNYEEILDYLSRGVALNQGGTLVIEHHAEMFFPEKIGVLKRWRVVAQGETSLSFYERK